MSFTILFERWGFRVLKQLEFALQMGFCCEFGERNSSASGICGEGLEI